MGPIDGIYHRLVLASPILYVELGMDVSWRCGGTTKLSGGITFAPNPGATCPGCEQA